MVTKMKKIKIDNYKAVLSIKKLSDKKFSTLKWQLIEKNINEISEALSKSIKKKKTNNLVDKESQNAN